MASSVSLRSRLFLQTMCPLERCARFKSQVMPGKDKFRVRV